MTKNKKNIEKEELSKFISSPEGLEWIKQNNLVKIIKEEEKPDFAYISYEIIILNVKILFWKLNTT